MLLNCKRRDQPASCRWPRRRVRSSHIDYGGHRAVSGRRRAGLRGRAACSMRQGATRGARVSRLAATATDIKAGPCTRTASLPRPAYLPRPQGVTTEEPFIFQIFDEVQKMSNKGRPSGQRISPTSFFGFLQQLPSLFSGSAPGTRLLESWTSPNKTIRWQFFFKLRASALSFPVNRTGMTC